MAQGGVILAHYNRIKSQKIAPIGTIMAWAGSSLNVDSLDGIPAGWIICNASGEGLLAADYPILARIIGNTYGPFSDNTAFTLGVNYGIVNPYPYNKDVTKGHVDRFNVPNLNQRPLVDIESVRIGSLDSGSYYDTGDSRYNDLVDIGQYLSKNGTEGTEAKVLNKSNVSINFQVEAANNLAGRISGIVMDDPIYYTTVHTLPRKLGIDHMKDHSHRPGGDNDIDQFWTTVRDGRYALEFQPPLAVRGPSTSQTTSVSLTGNKGGDSFAHRFLPGTLDITWSSEQDQTLVSGSSQQNIANVAAKQLVPQPITGGRPLDQCIGCVDDYTDDNAAVSAIQQSAHVGSFPPPGYYGGRKNYYASPDIPDAHRGTGMGNDYIEDMVYDPATQTQPVNTNGPFDPATNTGNTYSTTLNHEAERWADLSLQSHKHEAMEVTMGKGLKIPGTILVNDIQTGTTDPFNIASALTVNVNSNTPSITMIYIMRAF